MAAMNGQYASGAIRGCGQRRFFRRSVIAKRNSFCRISFEVAPRSFLVITGPSGCGKSTLLNIIAGLDRDYEGAIDLGPAKDGVTFIFQTPRLLPWRTLYENIALALPDGDPRHAEIPAMLDRVGLREAQNAYPEMLSLGMQRRAALARGSFASPKSC
jgi:NitT/TauT family transport system ATP-binding protein